MARIRTIKPEFFTSESILSVSPLARLFFIGLWCEADREGRLKWKPKTLKFRYLPADNTCIDDLSEELKEFGMIEVYTIDKIDYCSIPGFKTHQVINNRERESELPSRVPTRKPRVKAEGREGKEGKGKEGNNSLMTCPPENLNKEAWQRWLEYKIQIKDKYKTERGESSKAAELIKLSSGDIAMQGMIVDQSINSEWKGFFQLKEYAGQIPQEARKKPRGFGE